ncbi:four helix bundle protein [Geminisphaera colitermitum]|uniref:four helix bundle protein n=1 Tax=Geminisphaera colitermitum TaxID=1148786 RepID=UPI000158D3AE|nr:four helix bundle protein [Geminisphaera colitermitum]
MKGDNAIQTKSYAFAIRVVKLCRHLMEKKKEFVLSKQLVRSGTGIGANVEEALGGQSRADFVAKMTIAYKEARETSYWLRLLKDTDYLTSRQFQSIHEDMGEIHRLLTAILKSTKGD